MKLTFSLFIDAERMKISIHLYLSLLVFSKKTIFLIVMFLQAKHGACDSQQMELSKGSHQVGRKPQPQLACPPPPSQFQSPSGI